MLTLGPLAFAAPWILGALAVLPVLWWLLRVTPPAPRTVDFPAIRLLRDLVNREETPARTPLWLLILRIVLAALIILALARPLLNPDAALPGGGPLLLVVDNGWASGRDWPGRQASMNRLIDQADRQGRPVILLPTARPATGDPVRPVGPLAASAAREQAQTLAPLPWPTDRAGALTALEAVQLPRGLHTIWLSDGVLEEGADAPGRLLAERLRRLGGLEIMTEGAARPALLVRAPAFEGTTLTAVVERSDDSLPLPVTVHANAADGRLLATADGMFQPGEGTIRLSLDLPTELRNEVSAVRLDGQTTAGSVALLDERWKRRPVGLVAGHAGGAQPLLSDLYYLEQALGPFAEVRRGTVAELLKRDLAVLVLTDVGNLSAEEQQRLDAWVRDGGTLVRFAGPLLAKAPDTLIPVRLRGGDRALGGALSWSEPARLSPFDAASPFHGLAIPKDVLVTRQVLAEPEPDLAAKTWARLQDGTPLVTADRPGEGLIVLFHTTANPDWSNLSISGLFVEMLRRVVSLSAGVGSAVADQPLPPLQVLDGFGRLIEPPATVFPLPAGELEKVRVDPRHPPGIYGVAEAGETLNLAGSVPVLTALRPADFGAPAGDYAEQGETELKPWFLGIALALAVLDLFIGLALRGLLPLPRIGRRGRQATAALLVALGLGTGMLIAPQPVQAQDLEFRTTPPRDPSRMGPEERAVAATTETWLAYVQTGDRSVDAVAKAGLEGLADQLGRRTAVEIAGAMPVDLEQDELAFFPLIYWPVTQTQAPLSDAARQRLNAYLREGGLLLVDTRDQGMGFGGAGGPTLERLLAGIDIPPLAPVGPEHVLTKAFYLLQDFPGRYAGGDIWVEAQESRLNDGVSPVVIGSNDWAGAWAVDSGGRPLNAVVPGPERQREMAYRFGINLVMYALTGNYKADQVHVPAILERLGQ